MPTCPNCGKACRNCGNGDGPKEAHAEPDMQNTAQIPDSVATGRDNRVRGANLADLMRSRANRLRAKAEQLDRLARFADLIELDVGATMALDELFTQSIASRY